MTRSHIHLVIGFSFLLAASSAVRAEVLIGLATPLSGHMAWAGASDQVGAESAVADLNAKAGVLGERIELIVVDDACDPEQAVAAAEKLVDAGVALVVSCCARSATSTSPISTGSSSPSESPRSKHQAAPAPPAS